jgi:hypothetical protein
MPQRKRTQQPAESARVDGLTVIEHWDDDHCPGQNTTVRNVTPTLIRTTMRLVPRALAARAGR